MNAPFDLTLLDRELKRHRASSPAGCPGNTPPCVLDPRVLDKHLDRYRKGRRTLTDLCELYGVVLNGAHDAAADAAASLELVRAVGRRFATRLERLTPAEPHALHAVWHAAQARGPQAWFTKSGTPETVTPRGRCVRRCAPPRERVCAQGSTRNGRGAGHADAGPSVLLTDRHLPGWAILVSNQ